MPQGISESCAVPIDEEVEERVEALMCEPAAKQNPAVTQTPPWTDPLGAAMEEEEELSCAVQHLPEVLSPSPISVEIEGDNLSCNEPLGCSSSISSEMSIKSTDVLIANGKKTH